ncbi:hypothetical protein BpHYR1_014445 [Brachionus plicatilis]|uniref:Uncharacterized protein n=1 Tax=Brachionus plicatilis TaxID=10195 RepID=A0A3M7RJR0_BRAPC|nr:hypothetical protein BpHYR1_014445 [Brachionus plicatilis]
MFQEREKKCNFQIKSGIRYIWTSNSLYLNIDTILQNSMLQNVHDYLEGLFVDYLKPNNNCDPNLTEYEKKRINDQNSLINNSEKPNRLIPINLLFKKKW